MPSTSYSESMRSMYASLASSERTMNSSSDARAMERMGSAGSSAEKIQLLQYVDATTAVRNSANSDDSARRRPHTGIPSQYRRNASRGTAACPRRAASSNSASSSR